MCGRRLQRRSVCLGAREPVLSLACGASPELRTVLRARLSDSIVLEALGGAWSCRAEGGWMDTIVERPAALDVHKAQVTACVRVPNDRGEREERIAESPRRSGACWPCATGCWHTRCSSW